jgi:hypothetical protein
MAAPSTGVTRVNSGLAVLVRDYGGTATDVSPGGTFGSPFAPDGKISNDLLITTPVSVWAKPLSTVEDVGTNPYFQGKPASNPFVERPQILIRSDRAGGPEEPTAEPYPRAVLKDVGEADVSVPPRRHRGIAGRVRAGGVMTNHPASSSGFEEAARASAADPPPGTGTGHLLPTARPRLKQYGATPRCAPSDSSALKTPRYRSLSTNSRSRSPSLTPTTTNCAANSLQSASSGTHFTRRR